MTNLKTDSIITNDPLLTDLSSMQVMLKFPEPRTVKIDPKRTLLQIVDMQTIFVGLENRKKMWHGDDYTSNIASLLHKARELDMVVVFQYSTSIRNPYEKTSKGFRYPSQPAEPSYGQIIDEVKPLDRPNEYIVSKTTHDIFFHTHMDDLLNKLPSIDTVILTGTVTNICVMYAERGYSVRGYKVIIPMDGVIARSPESQVAALHLMVQTQNYPATPTLSNMITFD
jgi:nicotinamidase-related amidase